MDIAVIGPSSFTLGFRLAGVSKVVDVPDGKSPEEGFRSLLADAATAIIVTDEATMSLLDERMRNDAEASVQPVVVTLSAEPSQEGMRKLIQKSIGVDLWKD